MDTEIFADAVGAAAITGPVVRLDLVSMSPTEKDEKGQPKAAFRQRIVMPVDGFVRSFALMAQLMQQLEKQGVIKRQAAGEPAAETASPKSKNFK